MSGNRSVRQRCCLHDLTICERPEFGQILYDGHASRMEMRNFMPDPALRL